LIPSRWRPARTGPVSTACWTGRCLQEQGPEISKDCRYKLGTALSHYELSQ
jgi:hypothetical protein